jgi:hypothetical protein
MLRPLLFLLRCSSVGIQISGIELFAARKQRLIQQTFLKLAGYALESLFSTYVTEQLVCTVVIGVMTAM